ncbi:MAG: signal peptidase I [Desulfomonilaceae bacterium]
MSKFYKFITEHSGPNGLFKIFCQGFSMSPIIRRSDTLYVLPYNETKVHIGDVVVFKSIRQPMLTVHRVLRLDRFGIATIGDNNDSADPHLLNSSDIIGKVVYLGRRSKLKPVHGGWSGSLVGRLMRLRRLLDYHMSRIAHPLYELLVRHKIFVRWPFCSMRTKVVSFTRNGTNDLQLLWRGRVIGWFVPEVGAWIIKRPFRLFVDQSILPVISHVPEQFSQS